MFHIWSDHIMTQTIMFPFWSVIYHNEKPQPILCQKYSIYFMWVVQQKNNYAYLSDSRRKLIKFKSPTQMISATNKKNVYGWI